MLPEHNFSLGGGGDGGGLEGGLKTISTTPRFWEYMLILIHFFSVGYESQLLLATHSLGRDGKTCRYCRYICAIFLGSANFLAVYAQTN